VPAALEVFLGKRKTKAARRANEKKRWRWQLQFSFSKLSIEGRMSAAESLRKAHQPHFIHAPNAIPQYPTFDAWPILT
jgi:hypothetical protein